MATYLTFGAYQTLGPGEQAVFFVVALLLTRVLLYAMMPFFRRYALARPNARSSHKVPTPQGGGIAFMAITLLLGISFSAQFNLIYGHALVFGITLAGMVTLGALDDIRPLSWWLRLCLQAVFVAVILINLPQEWRIFPALPLVLERAFALLLGLWFVNLSNFMDGIDGILVVGLAPMAFGLGIGFGGIIPPDPLALAFSGALCGFFLMNRPPARLFSGDAGALSAGLLVATVLYALAARYSLYAALILPLYFGMDATQTLFIRLKAKKNLTHAHRDHAYQNAVDQGLPVSLVIARILILNVFLVIMAGLTLRWPHYGAPAFIISVILTFMLIRSLRAGRR